MADTASQSNTKEGKLVVLAGEALTGMEGRLVKLSNSSGTPVAILPNDVADEAVYILLEGAASGENVTIEPLTPGKQFRAYLDGTCVTGDQLVLAAINGTKDGKLVELPATADSYFRVGLAEQSGVDGQLVLFRYLPKDVTVS